MTSLEQERYEARAAALRESGKTLDQVARECGLKPATVRAYIRKPATHRLSALRLAKALGCPMELLRR